MAGTGVELGKAYVSIAARTDGLTDEIKKGLKGADSEFKAAGAKSGKAFTEGASRPLSAVQDKLKSSGMKGGKSFSSAAGSEISKGLRSIETEAGKASDRLTKNMRAGVEKGAKHMSRALAGVAAGGGAAFLKFTKDAMKAGSDFEQSMGGIEAVFGKYSERIREVSLKNSASMELNAVSYQNYARGIGKLFKGAGLEGEELSKTTIEFMQRAADYAGKYNYDTGAVMEAFESAARGRTLALSRYGLVLDDAALKEAYFHKTGKQASKTMTAAEKAIAVQAAIMEKTGAAAGGMSEKMNTLEGRQNKLKNSVTNLKVRYGEMLLPAMMKAAEIGLKVADAFEKHPKLLGGVAGALVAMGATAGVLAHLGRVMTGVSQFAKAAALNSKRMAGGIATAGNASAKNAPRITRGIKGINAALKANPIGAVMVGVGLLTAAVKLLYKHCTPFRKFVDGLKKSALGFLKQVPGKFKAAADTMGRVWKAKKLKLQADIFQARDRIKSVIVGIQQSIRGNVERVKGIFSSAKTHVLGIFDKLKGGAEGIARAIGNAFKNVVMGAIRPVAHALGAILSHVPNIPGSFDDKARAWGSQLQAFSTGGRVKGRGGDTDDLVPAMLSNGEFVINAKAVRAVGVDRLEALNSGNIPRFATGGLVSFDDAMNFVQGSPGGMSLQGAPYVFGGTHWGDCSGTQSSVADFVTGGGDPWTRHFATGNQQAWLSGAGFRMGGGAEPPYYGVGWMNGGAGGGHTAGTLVDADGRATNIEMGGSTSAGKIGGAAAGWQSGQFTSQAWFPLIAPENDSESLDDDLDLDTGEPSDAEKMADEMGQQQTWSDLIGTGVSSVVKSAVSGHVSDVLSVFGWGDELPPALSAAMEAGTGIRQARKQIAEDERQRSAAADEKLSSIDEKIADTQEKMNALPEKTRAADERVDEQKSQLAELKAQGAKPEQIRKQEQRVKKAEEQAAKAHAKEEADRAKLQKKLDELEKQKAEAEKQKAEAERAKRLGLNLEGLRPGIDGDPVQKFAKGGSVKGKPGKDKIRAMLSNGEFVINADTVKALGVDTLEALNSGALNGGERGLRAAPVNAALSAYDSVAPQLANRAATSVVSTGGQLLAEGVRTGGRVASSAVERGTQAAGNALAAIPGLGAIANAVVSPAGGLLSDAIAGGADLAGSGIEALTPIASEIAGFGAEQVSLAGSRMMHAGVDTLNGGIPTVSELVSDVSPTAAEALNMAANALPAGAQQLQAGMQRSPNNVTAGGNVFNFYTTDKRDMFAKFNKVSTAAQMGMQPCLV